MFMYPPCPCCHSSMDVSASGLTENAYFFCHACRHPFKLPQPTTMKQAIRNDNRSVTVTFPPRVQEDLRHNLSPLEYALIREMVNGSMAIHAIRALRAVHDYDLWTAKQIVDAVREVEPV